ncbi:Fe-S cluster domain protein [Lachnoclostridium phytofermentans ISDg]|uniref:Fe-S cluster domain protein n=2 Tax=Lachnoclostridium phytofermentans TaxID=66219 RepID=A9KKF4_LACP7|nr:Fe-S cluster domain protein [Lachnoclostridium phytofermentans ISDg]
MTMGKFHTAVRLDENLCKGCINCIKRCPTEAIRVRNQKAVITKEFCIDCGECIRICPHHAKNATYDSMDMIKQFEYTVALPAPSLYAQMNNLDDINIVLNALKLMGFSDVFEVSGAAEIVSAATRMYIEEHKEKWPVISTACPVVTRLIRVRFPSLLEHLLPLKAPVDIAAELARKIAMEKTGLPSEKIGIFFISPCPAKVTAAKNPLGYEKSEVDGVLAIKDVYPQLISCMKTVAEREELEDLAIAGKIGISWGSSGGEASGLLTDSYLAADGIENIIRVLEDMEDQKFTNLEFIELNACNGGCVGGVLTVENPYVAKVKLKRLRKYMPVARTHIPLESIDIGWTQEVEYEPVFNLGVSLLESIGKVAKVEELCKKFPGLDCGSCGAPTCKALAEDIVRGVAEENYCIHIFREYVSKLSGKFTKDN